MEIKLDVVQKIADNAKAAKEIYESLVLDKEFRQCLHLRPTKSGITIVSTFSYAPMRGISISKNTLAEKLQELNSNLNSLCGVDDSKACEKLQSFGFKKRSGDAVLEENIQTEFIKGMLCGQADYEGITFVASELILADKSPRFDIVGLKGSTLYIFELKKDRTTKVTEQVSSYVKWVQDNKDLFLKVLCNYPNHSVSDFSDVKGIAIMRYAVNATPALRQAAKDNEIGLWYYQPALRFTKE